MSTDVLGGIPWKWLRECRLDQIRSGKDHQIPLKLPATGFSVGQSEAGCIVQPQVDPGHRQKAGDDRRQPSLHKPKWLSGGGGMVSTAGDYSRFCKKCCSTADELNGARLLSPKTVALMTSDHLPPGVKYNASFNALLQGQAPTPEMGGKGLLELGFLVRKGNGTRNPLPGSIRRFLVVRRPRRLFLDECQRKADCDADGCRTRLIPVDWPRAPTIAMRCTM